MSKNENASPHQITRAQTTLVHEGLINLSNTYSTIFKHLAQQQQPHSYRRIIIIDIYNDDAMRWTVETPFQLFSIN